MKRQARAQARVDATSAHVYLPSNRKNSRGGTPHTQFVYASLIVLAVLAMPATAMAEESHGPQKAQKRIEKNTQTKSILKGRYNELQEQLKTVREQMKTLSRQLKRDTEPKTLAKENNEKNKPRERPQDLFAQAEKSFVVGDYARAIPLFEKLVVHFPKSAKARDAQMRLADIYMTMGDRPKALSYYEAAQSIRPSRHSSPRRSPKTTLEKADMTNIAKRQLDRPQNTEPDSTNEESLIGYLYSPKPLNKSVPEGTSDDFLVNVGDRVFFASDKTSLDERAKAVLTKQVTWLKKFNRYRVIVEGHADERGTRDYNIAIGSKRADSVKHFLINQGIDVKRMRIISYGKERPVALCNEIRCWAQNRRVVIRLNGKTFDKKTKPRPRPKGEERTVYRFLRDMPEIEGGGNVRGSIQQLVFNGAPS